MSFKINEIYNMNCIDGMKLMDAESVDLIVTDPPYGINYGENEGLYNRPKGGVLEGYIDVPAGQYKQFTDDWIKEAYRVLKVTGSIYIVSGWQHYSIVEKSLKDNGFTIINPIVWVYQFGVYTKKKFVNSFNQILFAVKNPRKYKFYKNCRFSDDELTPEGNNANYKDRENVWYITKERWEGLITTPTKLPYNLIAKIIQYSSNEGDTVLDPFLGSGQSAFVCRDLNRSYIGFEKSAEYFKFAEYRLRNCKYKVPISEWEKECA